MRKSLFLVFGLLLLFIFPSTLGTITYAHTLSPTGIQHYYALAITNSQSTATPSQFQQMINITSSTSFWSDINITSGYVGSNILFFYANGTIIPSWMENYYSSHSPPYILWWIKIGSIPASSSITIYMGIGGMNTNYYSIYSGTVGEAPQLSPSYGEYDSGANVFNSYWNFAGTTLPSGLTAYGNQVASVNNKLTLNWTSGDGGLYITNGITAPQIIEALSLSSVSSTYPAMIIGESSATSDLTISNQYGWLYPSYDIDYYGGYWRLEQVSSSTRTVVAATAEDIIAGDIYGFVWVSTGNEMSYLNYVQFLSSTDTTNSWSSTLYPYIGIDSSLSASFSIQWLRTRAYPPNGVMPSVTIYPISQVSVTLNSSNGVNQLSSTNYFVLKYYNGSTYTVDFTSNATYTFYAYKFNITQVSSGSTANERWALPSAINVVGSAGSYTYTYYTQYAIHANYSVLGTGSGWNTPQLTYISFGKQSQLALLTSTQTAWADAGTGWSLPTMISSATQEWLLQSIYQHSGNLMQSSSISPVYIMGNLLPVETFQGSSQFEYTLPVTGQIISYINNTMLSVNSTTQGGYNFQHFPPDTTIYIFSPSGQQLLSYTFSGSYSTAISYPANSELYVFITESSSPISGVQVLFMLIYAVGLAAIYLCTKSMPLILIVMMIASLIMGTFFVPQMRNVFYVVAALSLAGLLYKMAKKSGNM